MTVAQPTEFLGVRYRSKLEATFAAILQSKGVSFHYEPKANVGYQPDFFIQLPDSFSRSMLVELKPCEPSGCYLDALKEKISGAKKNNPLAIDGIFCDFYVIYRTKAGYCYLRHSEDRWIKTGNALLISLGDIKRCEGTRFDLKSEPIERFGRCCKPRSPEIPSFNQDEFMVGRIRERMSDGLHGDDLFDSVEKEFPDMPPEKIGSAIAATYSDFYGR